MINYKVSLDAVIPLSRKISRTNISNKGVCLPICEAKMLGEYDFKNRDHVHTVAKKLLKYMQLL